MASLQDVLYLIFNEADHKHPRAAVSQQQSGAAEPVSTNVPQVISDEVFLFYVDTALDGMVAIVTDLGADLANERPDIPGANSPYVILTHCLGVMEWWGGHVVTGRPDRRDRDAEFTATGAVSDLAERVRRARDQLGSDVAGADFAAPPRNPPQHHDDLVTTTQGAVLLHIYEELAQHRGQMEITRDLLLADR